MITAWVNDGACETPYDAQWRLAASCHSASLHAFYPIIPENSLYLNHFDDGQPSRQKGKFSEILWGDYWPELLPC